MAKTLDRGGLMAFAAQALSARALTVSELREKLKRRAAEPSLVDEVMERLKESGYLNDQRFAESYAGWRRDEGGFGKTRVFRDLMARKVAPAVAKQAAEAAFEGADEVVMIEKFLSRKCRGKDLSEQKNMLSAYRKLRLAGFGSGNSIKVLKRFAEQAEMLEDVEDEQ